MDEEEDMDIAAAMGFASFGGAKKRKYDQTNSPKAKPAASGANTAQLGVRSRKTEKDILEDGHVDAIVEGTSNLGPPAHKPKKAQKAPAASGLADFLARAQKQLHRLVIPGHLPQKWSHLAALRSQKPSSTRCVLAFGMNRETWPTSYPTLWKIHGRTSSMENEGADCHQHDLNWADPI
jgi:hypothetical protein